MGKEVLYCEEPRVTAQVPGGLKTHLVLTGFGVGIATHKLRMVGLGWVMALPGGTSHLKDIDTEAQYNLTSIDTNSRGLEYRLYHKQIRIYPTAKQDSHPFYYPHATIGFGVHYAPIFHFNNEDIGEGERKFGNSVAS